MRLKKTCFQIKDLIFLFLCAVEKLLKVQGRNRLFFFLFDVSDFSRNSGRLTVFIIICVIRIFARKSNQCNQLKNMSKEGCKLKSDNVTVDKFHAGLVLHVGQR
jgi:hypothetical protein